MSLDDHLPRLKEAIWRRLGDHFHLMPKGLYERLGGDIGMHSNDVRRMFIRLQEEGWLKGVARSDGSLLGRIEVLAPRPAKEDPDSLIAWRDVLSGEGLSTSEIEILSPLHRQLDELDIADLISLARGLVALRNEERAVIGQPQFVVSARHLLSSSKILSQLPAVTIKAFVGTEQAWPEQIPYVVMAGPADPESVILIENPWAFERAIAAGLAERHALLVTFGYGLNRNGDGFGRQLASLVEDRAEVLIPIVRTGNPPPLATLFANPKISFWGDLDPEGLRIYQRLKRRLPQLMLSQLYEPMRALLVSTGGHPYTAVTGKSGQMPLPDDAFPDEPRAGELARLCATRGIDQEALSLEVIAKTH